MPGALIVWYGRLMPFESWTDYLVACLWLIPVWAGAFAFGYRVAERQGYRELKDAVGRQRELHRKHIAAIERRYGVDTNIPVEVFISPVETHH